MCGIVGFAGSGTGEQTTLAVSRMLDAVARRGPDDHGIARWDNAILGQCRLSIFDPSSAGHQPMISRDGRVGLVFNGAIYNFQLLRRELESLGARFSSDTDTEVLLHGYSVWGLDKLVARLRGMFAFGLWDEERRSLFLVRDRLGVKPLAYFVKDGCIAFASTVRALCRGGFVKTVDPRAVWEYLNVGYVPDDNGIYNGAAKVPAASVVSWSNGAVKIRGYWFLQQQRSARLSFSEAVDETEARLIQAVRVRLAGDVRVGSLLSGGIDSSLVCWAAKKVGAEIPAYTVALAGDGMDEACDAERTSRELGVRHEVARVFPSGESEIDELVDAYSEPFACDSALGMLAVSRAVKNSVTVLLTGDGGDEVFMGYPGQGAYRDAATLACWLPASMTEVWRSFRNTIPKRASVGRVGRVVHLLDFATGGIGAVVHSQNLLPYYFRAGLVGERLLANSPTQGGVRWSHRAACQLPAEFVKYHLRTRFVGEFMTKVDGSTMHHGLEARSPFLDQELWEFAGSLPFNILMRRRQTKAVLRELARRRVGPFVANGRKRGFSVPVLSWLASAWRPLVERAFDESILEREGWCPHGSLIRQFRAGCTRGIADRQLWYLFILERWLRNEQAAGVAKSLSLPTLSSYSRKWAS